jgi:hypothetical protein
VRQESSKAGKLRPFLFLFAAREQQLARTAVITAMTVEKEGIYKHPPFHAVLVP